MSNNKPDSEHRPTPEELLERVNRQEKKAGRGRMKLFLGFAAGVGKTYEMLSEANRRHERGQDVVIGYVETHGRKGTIAQIGNLEIVPRKQMEYRDSEFEEMDVDAVIARHPELVVVDELAHTNIPGSRHEKRYEDAIEILDAGINVLTTMNVQHLESLNDVVQQITGVKVRETVPDWVLGEADEIVTIDITPRALINRLERGDVYPTEKVPSALRNFFTEGNLSALREIALREVASEVDRSVQTYREEHNVSEPWRTQERVMICLSPDRPSDTLLRRGWRIGHRLHADLVAVYVSASRLNPAQSKILDADYAQATRLNIRIEEISGTDVAAALAEYAIKHQVTELIVGHSTRKHWKEMIKGSLVSRLIEMVPDMDVLVLTNKKAPQ
jgi:two-component system, OmpR family, sensor histidine kinase KdpD